MQEFGEGITASDFKSQTKEPVSKLEIYIDEWINLCDLGDENYLIEATYSKGQEEMSYEPVAATISAVIDDNDGNFHPENSDGLYNTYIKVGRKIKFSTGFKKDGTDYVWQWFEGVISDISRDNANRQITITGFDYSQYLTEVELKSPDNYWGIPVTKSITADLVSYSLPAACNGVYIAYLDGVAIYEGEHWVYNKGNNKIYFLPDYVPAADGTNNFKIYYFTEQVPENVVADILVAAGLYADQAAALADMDFIATGITLDRVWFYGGIKCLSAIGKICERCDYQFYFKYNNKPVFKPPTKAGRWEERLFVFSKNLIANPDYQENIDEVRNNIIVEGEKYSKSDEYYKTVSGDNFLPGAVTLDKIDPAAVGKVIISKGLSVPPEWSTTPPLKDVILSDPVNIYDLSHDKFADFVANEHLPGIDEDDMHSDSPVHVPVQQSVKAYVDALTAANIAVLKLAGASYDDIQDWINLTQSSGKTTTGAILTAHAPADGTIDIAEGTGFIKTTNSPVGITKFFNWDAVVGQAVDNNATSYIYIDYTAGDPVPKVTTTRTDIEMNRHFTLGRVYRADNIVHVINSGTDLTNTARRNHERLIGVRGFEHDSGGAITESGERYLESTAGVFWLGANRIETALQNTNNAARITSWYHTGGNWDSTTGLQQVDNTRYDDGADRQNLTNNKFGCMWCYIHFDGDLHIVYGLENGTLTKAQAATPPTIPALLSGFSILAAKIIIQEGDANFIEIVPAYTTYFPVAIPSEHNDMGGLQGGQVDEYYHFTSAQHTELVPLSFAVVAALGTL